MTMDARVNNQSVKQSISLSPENAVETVKWLFEKTFGKPGWKRLSMLCNEATKHDDWKATQLALHHADDQSIPLAFRKLYSAYAADTIDCIDSGG